MRLLETHLRQLVRGILLEVGNVPPPDEPGVAPDEALGQYAFPDDRHGTEYDEVDEEDTSLETRFFTALTRHYEDNNDGPLRDIWPEVIELNQQGLYPKLLRPPSGNVYRLMTVEPDRAALFMGVPEAKIRARPGIARPASNPPSFKPRGFLSSWTLDPEVMVENTGHTFVDEKPGECTLLLVADTADGEFLMNPKGFASGWALGNNYRDEQEVIGGGEIPLTAAAWIWHGVSGFDMHKFNDELEALLSRVNNEVKDLNHNKSMSPERRRAEERAIWGQFVSDIETAAQLYNEAGPDKDEPTALRVIRKYLEHPRQQASDPAAFDKLYDEIARNQGIEHIISHAVGRWLVTAAGYLISDMMMTIREVEGGHIGERSPESILRELLNQVK